MSDFNQPGPNPPIDPRGAQTPPPPPPNAGYPPAYGYAPPPAEKKGGLGGLTRVGGVISMALLLFAFGFYFALIVMNSGSGPQALTYQEGKGEDKIVIIPIEGMIMSGSAGFVRNVVDRIIDDKTVKAVVLRIDSPGGSVTPSDEIHRHIERLRKERQLPIVASYGGTAASGGYYVSCGADRIYIQPTCITGSIGVYGQVFTAEGLIDKLGIKAQMITSSKSTEKHVANDTFRSWTEQDIEAMTKMLDVMHERFVDVVLDGRGKVKPDVFPDRDSVYAVATGKAFTAQAAIDAGLCDEIGYLDDAIAKAQSLGGLGAESPVVIYRSPAGLFDVFGVTARPAGGAGGSGNGLTVSSGSESGPMHFDVSIDADALRRTLTELALPEPAYLMSP